MANKFLLIENNSSVSDNKITLAGIALTSLTGGGQKWVVNVAEDLPNTDAAIMGAEADLRDLGCLTIVDVQPGESVSFRIESGIMRCRSGVPAGIASGDVVSVPALSPPPATYSAPAPHVGFHPMCECGSTWESCGHDKTPETCCL